MSRRPGWAVGVAALALAVSPAAVVSNPRSLDLVRAGLHQRGPYLVLKLRTAEPWRSRDLRAESLCLELDGSRSLRRVCATGSRRLRLRYERLRRNGSIRRSRILPSASVRRPNRRSLVASFPFAAVGLREGRVSWRVFSRSRAGCQSGAPCQSAIPRAGLARLRIRRPRALGCTRRGRPLRRSGSHRHRVVAFGFDDGPSPYSSAVVRILNRFHVAATFFLIGRQVRLHPAIARRELLAGDEVGNHSFRHSSLPSHGDLRATSAAIEHATGFRPCVFRPPYGAVNRTLVDSALDLGMNTVLWDVDPSDWSTPGTSAIARRVLGAVHPGAIVIMHDGGGPRSQTVAALPVILRGLERRGYRVDTVSGLLGDRFRWYPR